MVGPQLQVLGWAAEHALGGSVQVAVHVVQGLAVRTRLQVVLAHNLVSLRRHSKAGMCGCQHERFRLIRVIGLVVCAVIRRIRLST